MTLTLREQSADCPPPPPQVVVDNAVQVAATGQLQTGVQFKIDDPTDIEPSVCILAPFAMSQVAFWVQCVIPLNSTNCQQPYCVVHVILHPFRRYL